MRYYEVWVSSLSFHGNKPLTYSSSVGLEKGTVVEVPLQNKNVVGIVVGEVPTPKFKTKPISKVPDSTMQIPDQLMDLHNWLMSYYPAPSGQITALFVPSNITSKSRHKSIENNAVRKASKLPPLTDEQRNALKIIQESKDQSFLLHGDTGTGKTRLYIEMARQQLENNQSVVVLTPEIGLTPQLVETFSEQFPKQVVVTHSHLTAAERRNIWLKIAVSDQAIIVIGPRSALFTPLRNIGIIVVDECHDNAYKQEQAPHYLATRVGAQLAKLHGAKLILGSATPNISDYHIFKTKGLPIIRMTKPAVSTADSSNEIQIVQIRDRANFSKSAWLSDQLLKNIQTAISMGQQSLVFLNRRGSARIVMCQACGWQSLCPKCDVPLTYHGDTHRMRCHTCGYTSTPPNSCPTCSSADILYKSVGTKAIFLELQKHFPEARIARFDSDNLKDEKLHTAHQDIKAGKIDILVGTQMLTKGLDLPKLSVVGIVAADSALSFPDYTAEEITYQQLSQVIGRVGRGHVAGKVVIQTYYPENPALKAIVNKNYSLFYEQQITERENFQFPPFSYILKLSCSRKSSVSAENACKKLHTFISTLPLAIEIIGPTPQFKQKQNDSYHWQLIIKAKKRSILTDIIRQLPSQISYDIDPSNLL